MGCLPADTLQLWTAELMLGLKNIHDAGIIHCDLKPENVLLTPSGHVAIGDFGFSVSTTETRGPIGMGTLGYIAPELGSCRGLVGPSCKSDIYALGIVILEMWIGTGENWYDLMAKRRRRPNCYNSERKPNEPSADLTKPQHLLGVVDDGDAMDLVHTMLLDDFGRRADWQDILRNPYLTSLDMAEISLRQHTTNVSPCAAIVEPQKLGTALADFHRECGMSRLKQLKRLMRRLRQENEGPDAVEMDYAHHVDARQDPTHGTSCIRLGGRHCIYSAHPHRQRCRRTPHF